MKDECPRETADRTDRTDPTDPSDLTIRRLATGDSVVISAAFSGIGWGKPVEQYDRYLREQNDGHRDVLVAFVAGTFAGYVTVNWQPRYAPLAAAGIPELQDLNVLPSFRRRGIATRLVDEAEELVGSRSEQIGIAVGLHSGYNAAQRVYGLRGYVPDGNGVTVRDEPILDRQTVVMDDDVVLHFVKSLGRAM
jgi:GNAT superfamily N-acetyltransferase